MSKILIIYANPGHEGHHSYMLNAIQEKLKLKNLEFDLVDLYAINYNPILKDSELYGAENKVVDQQNIDFQTKIANTDKLIFIYPTWWQNVPAILKGFFDRVFVSNFAFVYKNGLPVGLLKGKKAAIFTAAGSPRWYSILLTQNVAVKVVSKHVLNFCGIETKGFCLGEARQVTEKTKEKLNKIADKLISYLN